MFMSSLRRGRPLATAFVIGAFMILIPLTLSAQTNQPPQITSAPLLVISVDQQYSYQVDSSDPDRDTVAFTLTVSPDSMSLSGDTITWHTTVPGVYNVVLEATDGNNGYATQTWQITVSSGAVATIVIQPNDKPTEVVAGNNKQFVTTLFDQYGNQIPSPSITWVTDPAIGTISSDGLFTAKQGGIGFVKVISGSVEQSIGVIVKDAPIANTAVDTSTNEEATEEVTEETEETTEEEATEEVTEITNTETTEDVNVMSSEETTDAEAVLSSDEEATADELCVNMAHNTIILILILYGVAMALYFRYEKTTHSPAWWIFPILLTIIGLIIYYQNICIDSYLWWPWTLVGTGVAITIFYKGMKKSEMPPEDSQSQLPI